MIHASPATQLLQVPFQELSEDWRDDDIWVFTVRRQAAGGTRRQQAV
jgi:hypothetical protein